MPAAAFATASAQDLVTCPSSDVDEFAEDFSRHGPIALDAFEINHRAFSIAWRERWNSPAKRPPSSAIRASMPRLCLLLVAAAPSELVGMLEP
jgi:hypothetical protein